MYYVHVKTLLLNLYRDSLFRNSLYPMLASGVMAGFGFFFWLFSARLFTSEDIGLAGALISAMSMISVLSLAGFDTATVRFLAHEERKNESMNTGILVIGITSLLLASIFVAAIGHISPTLAFIQRDVLTMVSFVAFTTMASINMFTDAIFLAHRETKYTFIIDTVFSVVKVALPFAFIPWGAFGIFTAAATAQALGFLMSIGVLMQRFAYRPSTSIDRAIVRRVWRYSAGNYTADVLSILPLAALPIIITNNIGAKEAAYYYIVMMIVGLLYVIPASAMRSLLAEGSYDERAIPAHIRGSLKTTLMLLLPSMLVLFVGGDLVLRLFGSEYSTMGLEFLYIMTTMALVVAAFSLFGSLFRLTHNVRGLIVRNFIYATSTIALVYMLMPYGLAGVGVAYTGGYSIGCIVSYILFQYNTREEYAGLAKRFTFSNVIKTLAGLFKEHVTWPVRTYIAYNVEAYRVRKSPGFVPVTLLCYPEKPRTYHTLYKIAHNLGWKITNNPKVHADIVMHFEDITERREHPALTALRNTHAVINADCTDISKSRVNAVFEHVFGYNLSVDARAYTGPCVRKSETNGVHDGCILDCPTEPEEGYVYQKLIETHCGEGRVMDLRIPVFNDTIPFILKRYKSDRDLFDITVDTEIAETDELLREDERAKVLTFCRQIGLDYGELDVLRDNNDGKLYIVDVNNTPAGPLGPLYAQEENFKRWMTDMQNTLRSEFAPLQ